MKEIILVRIPVELIAKLREANPELEGIVKKRQRR